MAVNFIDELTDYIMGKVPTSRLWCEMQACELISTVSGKRRFIHTEYGVLYGNIFVIFIGPSGVAHKTIPQRVKTRPLLRAVSDKMNEKVFAEYGMTKEDYEKRRKKNYRTTSEKTRESDKWKEERDLLDEIEEKLVNFECLTKFTPQALNKHLVQFPVGMICGDEFTSVFLGSKTTEYLKTSMEQLSRLFDCDVDKTGTISRGTEYPKDAFVNFMSATTPYLFMMMDESFFVQGTGNRILWNIDLKKEVIEDVERDIGENSINFFYSLNDLDRDKEATENILQKLLRIPMLKEGLIQVDIFASSILYRYRDECYNQSVLKFNKDNLDIEASYIARLAENSMRLALLHCIGRQVNKTDYIEVDGHLVQSDTDGHLMENVKDVPGVADYQIIAEDAQWAVDKMKMFHGNYLDMWKLASATKSVTTKSYKNDFDRIISIMEKLGDRATIRNIMDRTGWDSEGAQNLLDTLLKTHRVRLSTERNSMGKMTTYYRIVPDSDPFRELEDEI